MLLNSSSKNNNIIISANSKGKSVESDLVCICLIISKPHTDGPFDEKC